MMDGTVYASLDRMLSPVDASLRARQTGPAPGRQPVHTVYVPADRCRPDLVAQWGAAALEALHANPGLPHADRVLLKLGREPIEDLRLDFEDGYGLRPDDIEDADVARVAAYLSDGDTPAFVGIRCKSLEAPTRHRAIRTLDLLFGAIGARPVIVTLPKVSDPAQVSAMVMLCEALEAAHGIPGGTLRFEIQIETPAAVLCVPELIAAAAGRCTGLHYGTYDYSAACGIAAAQQSMEHPAADHAKAVMQVAAAVAGVRLSDGSSNILPIGDNARQAWDLHARLVRRSLERGFYQGWDLHPAQLPTRFSATYAFFRDGAAAARDRLRAYLARHSSGVLDEPATARALSSYLLRGLDCGALDEAEAGFTRAELEAL